MPADVFEESILSTASAPLEIISWICLFLSLWQYYFNITDGAMEILVKFLAQLWNVLVGSFHLQAGVAAVFPGILYLFRKLFLNKKDKFVKYVVCIKCHFLYDMEHSFRTTQGERVTKTCKNVLIPDHPQKQHRQACWQELLKQVKNGNKKLLVPSKPIVINLFEQV